MKFRPCIDIHNGKVKQIVGSSLTDDNTAVKENFVSEKDAAYYANLYKSDGLNGGHIIMLNSKGSGERAETKAEALKALRAYPKGMQIGGGIDDENALFYIEQGASHIIVTSYIFDDDKISYEKLGKLRDRVGQKHIVIDLSCRFKDEGYVVVRNRWQTFTKEKITTGLLSNLSRYCDEFLIHGVDVEGKGSGMEEELIQLLSEYTTTPITYAGGISSIEDVMKFKSISKEKLNYTIGSALDIFGGNLPYRQVVNTL